MPSKYDQNQLWPKKHIMPGAIMTQDWNITQKAMFSVVGAGLGVVQFAYVFVLYLFCV